MNGAGIEMIIRWALCCAAIVAVTTSAWGADKAAPKKVAKAVPKAIAKTAPKKTPLKAARKPPAKPARVLLGKTETLTCRVGTEDRHARIGVVVIGDKIDSFAYYSKWKPRTCSIYLQRNRDYLSRWTDKGRVTNVSVEKGLFLIEHGKGEYRFVFRDVDRERYCGMDGTINGTLTIRKGSEVCQLAGIMEEGTPLGQAYAEVGEQTAPVAAAPPLVPVEAPLPRQIVQRSRRAAESLFPSAGSSISD
jgi:hypothetical protein